MFESYQIIKNSDIRLETLKKFYKNKKYLTLFIEIVTGTHVQKKLSLRMFDWVATNYTKKNNIMYKLPGHISLFDVHNDYQAQLKAFTKKHFDPFCRDDRILFKYKKGGVPTYVETTIAQLNFFKWAISNKVVDYVLDNFDDIFKDMNYANKKQRQESERYKKSMLNNDSSDSESESDEDESYSNKSMKKSDKHRKSKKNDSSDDESSDEEYTEKYSLRSDLTIPTNKVNILEFTGSKKKSSIKKRKTLRKPRQKLSASSSKDINKCKTKVKIKFI
jgi:hypothetical protein